MLCKSAIYFMLPVIRRSSLMESLCLLIPLLAVVAIFVLGARAVLSLRRSEESLICTTCGAQTDRPQ